jgi:hypothetical protein
MVSKSLSRTVPRSGISSVRLRRHCPRSYDSHKIVFDIFHKSSYMFICMSNYVTPDKVVSPRKNWQLIRVLETGSQADSNGHHVAVAIGTWREDDQDGKVVLGMRWNGNDDWPIGNPQSRGLPTWFIIPKRLNDAVIDTLSKDDQTLVRNLLKDPKK